MWSHWAARTITCRDRPLRGYAKVVEVSQILVYNVGQPQPIRTLDCRNATESRGDANGLRRVRYWIKFVHIVT